MAARGFQHIMESPAHYAPLSHDTVTA